jgi:hypothetical protein
MKNIIPFLLFFSIFLISCSEDSPTEPEVDNTNKVERPFNVKYEVSFSTNVQTQYASRARMEYSSEISPGDFRIQSSPGQYSYLSSSELTSGWSLSFTVTVDKSPLWLDVQTNFNPKETAKINFKIYINDVLVEDTTRTVNPNTDLSVDKLNGVMYKVD